MTETLEPIGEFPPRLYRAFAEKQWAEAFVNEGRLRFRPVQYFAHLEDSVRADNSEGKAHLLVPGDVTKVHLDLNGNIVRVTSEPGYINYSGEFVNPVFICCFSYPPDDDLALLPRKFGDFVVRIADPRQLARDVTERMTADGILRGTSVVECYPVSYNKGEKASEEPDNFTRTRLMFCQKSRTFSSEYEWRLASIDSRGIGNRQLTSELYDVVIGHKLPYATLLELSPFEPAD